MLSETHITTQYDVVVVGAGLAGLVAAYELRKKAPALTCCIVEASRRFGGQIQSPSEPMLGELGCRWIGQDQRQIRALCNELGVELEAMQVEMEDSDSRDWSIDRGRWAEYVNYELKRFVQYVNMMAVEYYPGRSNMRRESKRSMESFICGNLLFTESRNFVRLIVRYVSGCLASDITVVEYMMLCNGTNGITNQINGLLGNSDQLRLKPYFYRLVGCLVTEIGLEQFILNTKLLHIDHSSSEYVTLVCSNKSNFQCNVVILAIPPQAIHAICVIPELPKELRPTIVQNLQRVTVFVVRFNAEFWTESNQSGSFLLLDPTVLIAQRTAPATLTGLLFHQPGTLPRDSSPAKDMVLRHILAKAPVSVRTVQWQEATWELACIRGLPTTSAWRRIVWSGTNSATSYRGQSNGAVQGGLRGALLALLILRPALVDGVDVSRVQEACAVRPRSADWWTLRKAAFNLRDAVALTVTVPLFVVAACVLWRTRGVLGRHARLAGAFVASCTGQLLEYIP